MGETIQVRRGPHSRLPELANGEIALTTDTKDVYIGTPEGNELIGGQTITSSLADIAHLVPVRTATNISDSIQDLYNTIPDYTTLKVPSGTYTIDKPLIFNRNVHLDFTGVIFEYTGVATSPAVTIGKDDAYTEQINVVGLYVKRMNYTLTNPNEIGIRIVNLKYSRVEFSALYFYNLVVLEALGRGNVYNDYTPRWLYSGYNSLTITSNASGWCNENNFYGGSFGMQSTLSSVDKVHIKVVHNGYRQNNNRFFGCSFEDAGSSMYAINCDGGSHYFYGCRYEGAIKVKFGANSLDNNVLQGFGSDALTIEDLGSYNNIWGNREYNLHVGTDGFSVRNRSSASAKTFKLLNTDGTETFSVLGSGEISSSSSVYASQGFRFYNSTRGIFRGSGTPEGSVVASPGSVYHDVAGGVNGFYFKRAGTDNNSGWSTIQTVASNTTASRYTGVPKGFCMFDTTLNKPIWWDGTKWIDSAGATV